jgi:hypothetical protein
VLTSFWKWKIVATIVEASLIDAVTGLVCVGSYFKRSLASCSILNRTVGEIIKFVESSFWVIPEDEISAVVVA